MKSISMELFSSLFDDKNCPIVFTEGLSTQMYDLRVLRALINHFRCNNVLELGVRYGHTAKFLLDYCYSIKKYVGVDVPYSFQALTDQQQDEVPMQTGIIASFNERFEAVTLENGTKDIEDNIDILECKFDLIFIDADHSLTGVVRDTGIALKLIEKDGIIVWHDYVTEEGVKAFLDGYSQKDDRVFYVEDSWCCVRFPDKVCLP